MSEEKREAKSVSAKQAQGPRHKLTPQGTAGSFSDPEAADISSEHHSKASLPGHLSYLWGNLNHWC